MGDKIIFLRRYVVDIGDDVIMVKDKKIIIKGVKKNTTQNPDKGTTQNPTLSKKRMLEIEKTATGILKDTDFSKALSVDITSLVKKDGFDVQTQMMPIETTGMLFVNDSEDAPQRIIVVNQQFTNPDNETDVVFKKSRLIAAHEYGHYVLHKSPNEPLYAHRDTNKRDEDIELEADYFARSLLMPLPYFKRCYEILIGMSPNDDAYVYDMLSKLFRVTHKKVMARINDLSILGTN